MYLAWRPGNEGTSAPGVITETIRYACGFHPHLKGLLLLWGVSGQEGGEGGVHIGKGKLGRYTLTLGSARVCAYVCHVCACMYVSCVCICMNVMYVCRVCMYVCVMCVCMYVCMSCVCVYVCVMCVCIHERAVKQKTVKCYLPLGFKSS